MHWFKRHPEFLRAESASLAKNGNYKQLFQVRGHLFLSHGYILVRLEKIYRFPLLIVYTEATPFELPVIFILKDKLDDDFVKELSGQSLGNLSQQIRPYVRFYYDLRHQNASGALCILEWDNLDDGTQYLGISTILKRVRDWCAGTMTGEFPPDSQEVEFAAHFNDVESSVRFLYPETFMDEELLRGEAYAQLYTLLPQIPETTAEYRVYMGCLIIGEDNSGIVRTVDFDVPGLFKDEGIKKAQDLYTKPTILQAHLDSADWIKCFWFHLSNAPAPFMNVEELITIIGSGDRQAGIRLFHKAVYQGLKLKPDHFYLGLRFPNRNNELEFQLFKVYKNTTDQPTILVGSVEEIIDPFIASYTRISAIESEKLTEKSYHLRNSGRANHDILKSKFINIVGVGALGGEIADCITKAGPAAVYLFDNQRMKAHNAVRHLAGLNQIGLPKVVAVAHSLRQHNPFVHLEIFTRDINRFPVEEFLADGSVTISSIADDNVEAYLNERAVLANKQVYYVRALRGGKVARIFRVIPGLDACFQCLNLYRQDGHTFIDIPEDKTMPTLKNECNNPIRPASAADLKLIAAIVSRIVIDQLQGSATGSNHWIWTSEQLAIVQLNEPWQMHKQYIAPHPQCLYCHHDKKINVYFSGTVLKGMQDLVSAEPQIETGGVLAGSVRENGDFEVRFASGPGPKAIRSSSKFEKDIAFCQEFLDKLYSNSGAIYLGEWHSHPSDNNKPSSTDLKSLTEIAVQPNYLTENPLMVILSNSGDPSFSIHPANKIHYHIEPVYTA